MCDGAIRQRRANAEGGHIYSRLCVTIDFSNLHFTPVSIIEYAIR